MAHKLLVEDGTASMMFVGESPWHGLGTRLETPATSAEAIRAAGLDWEVIKVPLQATDGQTTYPIPEKRLVVRKDWWGRSDDNGRPLPTFGVHSASYTPLQNHEAFEFFDSIVGAKEAIYHTAGALGHGECVWILAKLPDPIVVVGDDVTDKYLLLSNNHDGTRAVQVKFTPIRVVCQNTLTIALSSGRGLRVPHVPQIKNRLKQVRAMLGTVNLGYRGIAESFRRMAKVPLNSTSLEQYLTRVFPDPTPPHCTGIKEVDERAVRKYEFQLNRVQRNRSLSECLYDQGNGNQMRGVRGTLWAAYNGVTELVDYSRTDGRPERRLESILFGEGYRVKSRAFSVADVLATAARN